MVNRFKREMIIFFFLVLTVSLYSTFAEAVLVTYEDFETQRKDKWNVSGGDAAYDIIAFGANGSTYAAFLNGANSIVNNFTYPPPTGLFVLEYYVYANTTATDTAQQNFREGSPAGTLAFALNPTFPSANTWGRFNGTDWVSIGVASNSGRAQALLAYCRVRLLIDNNNNLVSVRLGETSSDDLTNLTFNSGATNIDFVQVGSTGEEAYYDQFRYWNFSDSGWDRPAEPVTTTHFQTTAKGLETLVSLTVFNVTINGTTYSTTNGTVFSIINDSSLRSFTVDAEGFQQLSVVNHNVSQVYQANLTQLALTNLNITLTHGRTYVGDQVNISCTATNPTPFALTTRYFIENVDHGSTTNTTNNFYVLQPTDLFDSLRFYCQFNTTYNTSQTEKVFLNSTIDRLITFNAIKNTGGILSTAVWTFDNLFSLPGGTIDFFGDPFLDNTTSSTSINVFVEDTSLHFGSVNTTVVINETLSSYNITLSANLLMISFTNNSVSIVTDGIIADENKSINFTNATLIIVQQNLSEGHVDIRFGRKNQNNFTQFYEYHNDFTPVTEQIEILRSANWFTYIQVLDYGNAPIEDVTIRMESSNPSLNFPSFTPMRLNGQRLTDDEGLTFFWGDTGDQVKYTIMKSGYEPFVVLTSIGEEFYSKDSPLKVYLKENATTTVEDNSVLYVQNFFFNRTLSIPGGIVAPGRSSVYITTDYRNALSLDPYDITDSCSVFMHCLFTLTSGTDFNSTGVSNITLFSYLDGSLSQNRTIVFSQDTRTTILTDDSFDTSFINPVAFITLILISAVVGFISRNENMSATTFEIGLILLAFFSLSFLIFLFIIPLGYLLKIVHRVIRE